MSTSPAIKTVLHPVKDLSAAKAVFGALLGTEPVMDESLGGGLVATLADADGNPIGLIQE